MLKKQRMKEQEKGSQTKTSKKWQSNILQTHESLRTIAELKGLNLRKKKLMLLSTLIVYKVKGCKTNSRGNL
jgi:hypothetical protein